MASFVADNDDVCFCFLASAKQCRWFWSFGARLMLLVSTSISCKYHQPQMIKGFYFCKKEIDSEISGSHGGEYEDDCLLGCCTM
jgi:hypothetical protein